MKQGLYIKFHAWPLNAEGKPDDTPFHPDGVVDVTNYVMGVRWSESTVQPWGGLVLQMAVPFRNVRDIFPGRQVPVQQARPAAPQMADRSEVSFQSPSHGQVPEAGFWVEVGHTDTAGTQRAVGLYRCNNLRFGYTGAGGHVQTTPVIVEAENFLSFLASSRLQMAPAASTGWGGEGFVYSIETWSAVFEQLMGGFLRKPLGNLFAEIWTSTCKIRLPPSLSGETMGATIPVVFDKTTADLWSPIRKNQCQVVPGVQISAVVQPPKGGSILSFLLNLFGADPRIVELFPVTDVYAERGRPDAFTPLANKLGMVQPLIVYRLRPWLLKALTSANVGAEVGATPLGDTAATKCGIGQAPMSTEPAVDVDWFEFYQHHIENGEWLWTDGDRVNMAWGTHFSADGGSFVYNMTGTPLVRDAGQVQRHGLRVSQVSWPFFSSEMAGVQSVVDAVPAWGQVAARGAATDASDVSVIDYNNAITELCWAYTGESERFCRGTFRTVYRPLTKPGHWARFYLGDSCMTAYIETASHDVQIGPDGEVISGTTLAFSRGTLRYYNALESGLPETYQTPLMTASVNAPGSPASLMLRGLQEFVQTIKGLYTAGKKLWSHLESNPYQKMYGTPGPNKFPIYYSVAGQGGKTVSRLKQINGVGVHDVSEQAYRYIVIHQTHTTSVKGMVAKLKERKSGTHYSIDWNGDIVEWADPRYYWVDSSVNPYDYGVTPEAQMVRTRESIAIDFVLVHGAQPTQAQVRACSALLRTLSSTYGIPLVPGPDRKTADDPHLEPDEFRKYHVYGHRAFARKWTECPGTLDVKALVSYAAADTTITLVPTKDEGQVAQVLATAVTKPKK